MKLFAWSLVLSTLLAAGCSSESAEPEFITQRLAAPAEPAPAAEAEAADGSERSTSEAIVNPGCATLEASMTGDMLGEYLLAEGDDFTRHILAAFADFGPEEQDAVREVFAAVVIDDIEAAAVAFEEIDRLTLDRCGFPGGALMAISDFVPLIPFCVDDRITEDDEPVEQTCPGDEVFPSELPCFAPGDGSWLVSLTTGQPAWRPVACDTGIELAWSHREGDWVDAG